MQILSLFDGVVVDCRSQENLLLFRLALVILCLCKTVIEFAQNRIDTYFCPIGLLSQLGKHPKKEMEKSIDGKYSILATAYKL